MAPWVYAKAAKASRFHLQVKTERVDSEGLVLARVVRIFRGQEAIRIGEAIEFGVPVRERDDGPPGSHYLVYSRLLQAKYLEVFLNGEPPKFGNLGFLMPVIIAAQSAKPVTNLPEGDLGADPLAADREPSVPDTVKNLPPLPRRRRWWQFWKR
jgi:hypothetical protein